MATRKKKAAKRKAAKRKPAKRKAVKAHRVNLGTLAADMAARRFLGK
jgi:hypothetical protein